MKTTVPSLIGKIKDKYSSLDDRKEELKKLDIYWNPGEDQWSIIQVLAHIAEFQPFFIDELKKVIRDPGISWGRTMKHEGRMQTVKESQNQTFDEVWNRMERTNAYVLDSLDPLNEEDLQIESPHMNPKFGMKTTAWLVEHFIVEHLETHINQLDRIQRQYEEYRQQHF